MAQAGSPIGVGDIVNERYEILDEIGLGGFGIVYKVRDRNTGAELALKVLLPDADPSAWDELATRFEREKSILSVLRSDQVVRLVDYGRLQNVNAPGAPWYVMELLEGETLLSRVVRKGPLDKHELLCIFSQLRVALRECHWREPAIVHRYLKPENIFLKRIPMDPANGYTVKILDFGIAKILIDHTTGGHGTRPMGTPGYAAPEQTGAMNVPVKVSTKTDVWALGLIAFYVLTGDDYWSLAEKAQGTTHPQGRQPAQAQEDRLSALARSVAAFAASLEADSPWVVPPSRLAIEHRLPNGIIPRRFDEWFLKCVRIDQTSRYKDADEACSKLEEFLRDSIGPPVDYYDLDPDLAGRAMQTRETPPCAIVYCEPSSNVHNLFSTSPASELCIGADRSAFVGERHRITLRGRDNQSHLLAPYVDYTLIIQEKDGRGLSRIDVIGGDQEGAYVLFDLGNGRRYRANARNADRLVLLVERSSNTAVIVALV